MHGLPAWLGSREGLKIASWVEGEACPSWVGGGEQRE